MFTVFGLLFILGGGFLGGFFAVRMQGGGSPRADKDLQEVRERLLRLEQSMESMAGEVDRVSEGQRFMTALLEDRAKSHPPLPRARGADEG
jgi:hypothetical protein